MNIDIDFNNAAGYIGVKSGVAEAQYVVYYLSHAMLFCMGALVEAHVVVTPASCIYGERYKFDVFGGTHRFLEEVGIARTVEHIAIHRGYNHSMRWDSCSTDNVALLMLNDQFMLHNRQQKTEFVMNRLRYGISEKHNNDHHSCRFYGWGSRRNGYLIPLLIHLRRVDVTILPSKNCQKMWNYGDKYLCMQQFSCKDDLGSVIECSGFLRGMMTSRLIDRPCGVGFLDMSKYMKFLTCGVDDSRDILGHNDFMEFEFGRTTVKTPLSNVLTVSVENETSVEEKDPNDDGPPTTVSTESGEITENPPPQGSQTFETIPNEAIPKQSARQKDRIPGKRESRHSPIGRNRKRSSSDEDEDKM